MNKKSFFWASYADLMSSLFFIMLVLFVLTVVMLQKEIEKSDSLRQATERELAKIKEIQNAISNIDSTYFEYNSEHKKHVLKIDVEFPTGSADIARIPEPTLRELIGAGNVIKRFIAQAWAKDSTTQYLLIIEGQASRDNYPYNNELSYARALALRNYWRSHHVDFVQEQCEVIVAGSGQEGVLRILPDNATNKKNQRFLIHILPKPGVIK